MRTRQPVMGGDGDAGVHVEPLHLRERAAGAPSAGASPRFPADGPPCRPGVRTPPRRTAPRPGPRPARACRSLPIRAEARGARADPGPERPPGRRAVRPPPSSARGPGERPQRRRSLLSCRRPPGRGNGSARSDSAGSQIAAGTPPRHRATAPAPDTRRPALPGGDRSQEDPQHLPPQPACRRPLRSDFV